MKHWRQDWKYEDSVINTYAGNNTWVYNRIPSNKKQAVGHNLSIRLMTHLDIKAMEIGLTNLAFPLGKAMKLGDHSHEENTLLEMIMT